MKKPHLSILLICFFVLPPSTLATNRRTTVLKPGAQAIGLKLSLRKPNAWFKMLIPTIMGKVGRHADVDGGYYLSDRMEIDYDYWTYENTPNFLRDARGNYPKGPMLVCSEKTRNTVTREIRIDGRRAIIQECSNVTGRKESPFIYYVTFPRLRVSNGEEMRNGLFNLTIRYKIRQDRFVAARMVRSIDFKE